MNKVVLNCNVELKNGGNQEKATRTEMEKNDKKTPISEKIEIFVISQLILVEVMKTTPHALNSSYR